jgi:hypothetical protein
LLLSAKLEEAHHLWEEKLMTERDSASKASPTGPKLNPGDQAAPGTPGVAENVCPDCRGTGKITAAPCQTCGGTGVVQEGVGGA